jgi:hypothetical protein
MTTRENGNHCNNVGTTKKRAQAVKARLEELGHITPLTHAYEILATSLGYRNWPTMKAMLDKADQIGASTERKEPHGRTSSNVMGSTNTKIILADIPDRQALGDLPPRELLKNGSPDLLVTWIVGKIDDAGCMSAVWKGQAVALLSGILRALVHLRDRTGVDLTTTAIRKYLPIDRYIEFASQIVNSDAPEQVRRSIATYLNAKGYLLTPESQQLSTVVQMHGYLEALISDALSMIETDIKWHAFRKRGLSKG